MNLYLLVFTLSDGIVSKVIARHMNSEKATQSFIDYLTGEGYSPELTDIESTFLSNDGPVGIVQHL